MQEIQERQAWGLDKGGNWLSFLHPNGEAMQSRRHDIMNRLTQIGGSGSIVVEGRVNDVSKVTVNGQPAKLREDVVGERTDEGAV